MHPEPQAMATPTGCSALTSCSLLIGISLSPEGPDLGPHAKAELIQTAVGNISHSAICRGPAAGSNLLPPSLRSWTLARPRGQRQG